jgi:acyl-homoserine-lactone acylase
VYQLEVNPSNGLQYKVDDEWLTLEERVVKLKIKVPGFNLHVKRKTYWSIYGPTLITERGAFSIRTPGLMDIGGLEQWYHMNKSKNFYDFRKALNMHALPSYNVVYGDKFDTIYYVSNAKIPFRSPEYNWREILPGNTIKTLWTTIHPFDDLPQLLNPSSGYVYNTNHSPFKASASHDNLSANNFDSTMGFETHDNNRSLRVQELIEDLSEGEKRNDKITYQNFKSIKYDLQLPKKLAYPVNIDSLFCLDAVRNAKIGSLITTLREWDRSATIESKGAAVFSVFFYYVASIYKKRPEFIAMTSAQCVEALYYVKDYLNRHFGTCDITLGDLQKLKRGEKEFPLPGLPDVLAAMYSVPTENGRTKGRIGDCYISFVQFSAHGPEIETINCFGASNKKGNVHYDDQMKLFVAQKTKKMTLDRKKIYEEASTIYHPAILPKLNLSAGVTRGRR